MAEADPALVVASFQPSSPETLAFDVRRGAFRDPNWLYGAVQTPDLWQGDLVPHAQAVWLARDGTAQGYRGPVVLLSHGCDTEPDRDLVATVSPAFPLTAYLDMLSRLGGGMDRSSRERNIRDNKLTNNFFLPGFGTHPDRVVDFSFAAAVSTALLAKIASAAPMEQRLRLSRAGWYLFTAKYTQHVAHQERPDDYPRA